MNKTKNHSKQIPVIFLAFANDRVNYSRYLRNIPAEHVGIMNVLKQAELYGLCKVIDRAYASVDAIFEVFQDPRYRGRIAIFHYGGHANGYKILLESCDGGRSEAHRDGLVSFLAKQEGLKFVFLNGCSTEQHALQLVGVGIPAVVGTSQYIADNVASMLAIRFYKGIANGLPIERSWKESIDQIITLKGISDLKDFYWKDEKIDRFPWEGKADHFPWHVFNSAIYNGVSIESAWEEALAEIKVKKENHNSMDFYWNEEEVDRFPWDVVDRARHNGITIEKAWKEKLEEIKVRGKSHYYRDLSSKIKQEDRFPWDIHYKKGAENVKNWNLPDAANKPLFGLPAIPHTCGLPESPFLFLKRYERKHAKVFFGRSYYIRQIHNRITDPKSPAIILLYGQSGVGKSSLLDAGLIPRLERSHIVIYVRRSKEKGILGTLHQALDDYPLKKKEGSDPKKSTVAEKWKRIESETGKPLIIILDQAEEMFTRPLELFPYEFKEFLEKLKELFGKPVLCPKGKLVLGYRKEYHPEIDKYFGRYELPRSRLFLEPLNRNDIMDVAAGLTKIPELKHRYNDIEVEKNLPVIIADDLLKDKKSPIAPVLQIIMFKMWNNELKKGSYPVRFTEDGYLELRRQGIAMEDFFHQQMEVLKVLEPDAVDSGLALDLLKSHTTDLGTSCSRNVEDIRWTYSHRRDIINNLVQKLIDLYLLTYVHDSTEETSLTHDTLAPIVIKEFNDSDKPGQCAALILAAK